LKIEDAGVNKAGISIDGSCIPGRGSAVPVPAVPIAPGRKGCRFVGQVRLAGGIDDIVAEIDRRGAIQGALLDQDAPIFYGQNTSPIFPFFTKQSLTLLKKPGFS